MYAFWCSEHALFLCSLAQLSLGRKILPLVLASFKFFVCLDLLGNLCRPYRAITNLTRLSLGLLREFWIDICGCRYYTSIHRRCRYRGNHWCAISFALVWI